MLTQDSALKFGGLFLGVSGGLYLGVLVFLAVFIWVSWRFAWSLFGCLGVLGGLYLDVLVFWAVFILSLIHI